MSEAFRPGPRLIVDLGALIANLRVLERATPAAIAPVIKADAYGLGVGAVASALSAAGCGSFFTGYAAGGEQLRAILPGAEIFVLYPSREAAEIDRLLANELIPCLYCAEQIGPWVERARALGRRPRAALHFETGINRLAIDPGAVDAIRHDSVLAELEVTLVMGHLACADEPDSVLNRQQLDRFRAVRAAFPGARGSLANSGGIFLGADYQFDVVRPGIALYGHDPHYRSIRARVQPVATLQTELGQVRPLARGESVGYGASVSCPSELPVGVAFGGYADGIFRSLSDPARGPAQSVYVDGRRVPLFGRVSMDLITLDLRGFAGELPPPGAPVEIFGRNVPIEELAEHIGTIPYEILTQVGPRVRRIYQ